MNNSDLDSILKKARMPKPPEEFWEEFPQQMARQLNRARTENFLPKQNWRPRLVWAFATVICVLIAFCIGHWRGQTEIASSKDILANAKLVQDTLAMFPNQVRAIVQDNRGLHLILADSNNVPASAPLYVRICDGKNCESLVTFSGQEIRIAGQKMTVLSDTQGGIILMGNDFAWSSRAPAYATSALKIEAKTLTL